MGGFFGVAAKSNCTLDLFYGVDYHSHLGTRRGGMATFGPSGFSRAIHNIENSPFRTKFERDVEELQGNLGIGCISDFEPQPLLIQSHLGSFAITTVGKINNMDELLDKVYAHGHTHFQEMSGGQMQRIAIARALAVKPAVVFADEPTGALDQATGREVMGILMAAARDNGSAVVVVTHDPNVASFCGRTVMMQDGRLHQTDANPNSAPAGGGCQPQADWGWPEGAEPPSASLRSAAPAGGSETTAGGAR